MYMCIRMYAYMYTVYVYAHVYAYMYMYMNKNKNKNTCVCVSEGVCGCVLHKRHMNVDHILHIKHIMCIEIEFA